MATTWIKTIHPGGSNSIPVTIKKSLDYIDDDKKTGNGLYVITHMCNNVDAHDKFYETMLKYEMKTGRTQDPPILCYHARQSFKPGEITPEKSLEIGSKMAMEMTQGNYAFVVATHIDRGHIHNHIIINAYNEDCDGKFSNHWKSYKALRHLSDEICRAYGLSVIEKPSIKTNRYSQKEEYEADPTRGRKSSNRNEIEYFIEKTLQSFKPTNKAQFYEALASYGVEIKDKTADGKKELVHTSMRLPTHKKFTRQNKLSSAYQEAALEIRFKENAEFLAAEKEERRKKFPGVYADEKAEPGVFDNTEQEQKLEPERSALQAEKEAEEKAKAEKETEGANITTPVLTAPKKTPDKNYEPEHAAPQNSPPQNEQEITEENEEENLPSHIEQPEPQIMGHELALLHTEREAEEKAKAEKEAEGAKIIKPVLTALQKTPDKNFEQERTADTYSVHQSPAQNEHKNDEETAEGNPRFRVMQIEPEIVASFKPMIDMRRNIKAQTIEEYMLWCIHHNIRQTFETLRFLRDLNLDTNTQLNERMDGLKEDINFLSNSINKNERRMKEIKEIQENIGYYEKTHKFYDEYQRTKDPDYYKKHEIAIKNCKSAKDFFDTLGTDKLPKISELKKEYSELLTQNNKYYAIKNSKLKYLNELNKARKNLDLTTTNNLPPSERTSAKEKQRIELGNRTSKKYDSR